MTILMPRVQPSISWQWTGQPTREWPAWVRDCCVTNLEGELFHDRQSGRQIVYLGEWLVRDLDGSVVYYTDDEVRGRFA